MNWKDALYDELRAALASEAHAIPINNIERSSNLYSPPPFQAAPPANIGIRRNELSVVARIVSTSSRSTLAALALEGNYAQFRTLSVNDSYLVYQTVGAFHDRLVDRTRALLRRLCLEVTIEARNFPARRPDYITSLGLRSSRARTQMTIALTRVINSHTKRGNKALPHGVAGKLRTAALYGDVVTAIVPVYTAALRRK